MFRISISGPKPDPSTEYLHVNKHYKHPKALYNCSRKFCSLTHAQTHKHSRVHPQKVWVATCCTPNPSPLAAVQLGGLLPLAQLEVAVPAGRLLAASHQVLTIYLQDFCPLHKYSCCFYASLQAHSFLQVFQLLMSVILFNVLSLRQRPSVGFGCAIHWLSVPTSSDKKCFERYFQVF